MCGNCDAMDRKENLLAEGEAYVADLENEVTRLREKLRRATKHIAKREKEIRFMLREAAGDQGTIDRLKRELREPCQRCEMRREQESRR